MINKDLQIIFGDGIELYERSLPVVYVPMARTMSECWRRCRCSTSLIAFSCMILRPHLIVLQASRILLLRTLCTNAVVECPRAFSITRGTSFSSPLSNSACWPRPDQFCSPKGRGIEFRAYGKQSTRFSPRMLAFFFAGCIGFVRCGVQGWMAKLSC